MEDKYSTARDGGFASRKLHFALFSSLMILLASRICPGAGLGEVVMGIVSVCAIYITGNTVVSWRAADIEKARNTIPGVMGKIVEKAVNIAEKKEAKEEAAKEPDVVEVPDG